MDRKEYMKEYMKKKRAEKKNPPEQTKPVGYIREEVPVQEAMPPSIYHQTPEEFNAKVEVVVRRMLFNDPMFKGILETQEILLRKTKAMIEYLETKGNFYRDMGTAVDAIMEDDVPL